MKKPRLKTVYKKSSEICDVYAAKSQEYGKINSKSRRGEDITPIYFISDRLYSYGRHYLLAKIDLVLNGITFSIVNYSYYSQTTSGHSFEAYKALKKSCRIVVKVDGFDLCSGSLDSELVQAAIDSLKNQAEKLKNDQYSPVFDSTNLITNIKAHNRLVESLKLDHLLVDIDHKAIKDSVKKADLRMQSRGEKAIRMRNHGVLFTDLTWSEETSLRQSIA